MIKVSMPSRYGIRFGTTAWGQLIQSISLLSKTGGKVNEILRKALGFDQKSLLKASAVCRYYAIGIEGHFLANGWSNPQVLLRESTSRNLQKTQ